MSLTPSKGKKALNQCFRRFLPHEQCRGLKGDAETYFSTALQGILMDLRPVLHAVAPRIKALRRRIHMYPEKAWLEYATASLVAQACQECHAHLTFGEQAVCATSRLVPPTAEVCAQEKARAMVQGASSSWVEAFGDGLTGLWADIHFPASGRHSDILAVRFDMDANEVAESVCAPHAPYVQGFVSQNPGIMHACGHDGHVAMGVGLLWALDTMRTHMPDIYEKLSGTLRFVFQPAEEIGQGAKAMLDAGAMDGVRELVGIHLGIQARKKGELICGTTQFLANSSFEIDFHGRAAHAGLAPHTGQNALMAAITAAQGIQAIARHGDGASRVNIGQMRVEGAANVIPAHAWLAGETRGITTAIDDYMHHEATRISRAAGQMWDCTTTWTSTGTCPSGASDMSLAQEIYALAQDMSFFDNVRLTEKFWASEDFTWFLQDVQQRGGRGTFIQLGIDWVSGHHTACFDYDDEVLLAGVELLLRFVLQKLGVVSK